MHRLIQSRFAFRQINNGGGIRAFFTQKLMATAILWLLVTLTLECAMGFGDSSLTKERTITEVSTGVYVIRHKDAPNGLPNGNTEVIIGDREVLVVDSCYLASEARQDIAQIRKWTDKPVRYLVNTHWHNDHTI